MSIIIENTRFIYRTNFSGYPSRDTFGSSTRKANIIIPDEQLAIKMIEDGFNVKRTKPREDEEDGFEPVYFVSVIVNYDSPYPPKIYLVSGDSTPVLLDVDDMSTIDNCYVLNVNVTLNPYENQMTGRKSLYVDVMYVEQDIESDPFAERYINNR